MREIKFRAWSPAKNIWRADWPISSYSEILDMNAERIDDDLILSQYTGLHDKNDKEIYEGDILREKCGYDGVEWSYYTVTFGESDDCRWGFYLDGYGAAHTKKAFETLKVAGHIYENPEATP